MYIQAGVGKIACIMTKRVIGKALTFDDVTLVPRKSEIVPSMVETSTQLTKKIKLSIPLLSAAMDTVTETRMAVAMARNGGIGIIHKNLSIEEQVLKVDRVKRSENGVIDDPITIGPKEKLSVALDIMKKYHISGLPVTEGQKLVGILTNRDLRFEDNFEQLIEKIMTSKNLITAPIGTTLKQAKKMFQKYKIEKLPLVDKKFNIKGLITIKDLQKVIDYPNATKDSKGRLMVGAAVGAAESINRVDALVKVGVDVIVVDSAHGHSKNVIEKIKLVKNKYPSVQVIAGNVATAKATEDLIKAGADAVKVGMGPGSICTTRIIAGIGIPQFSAVLECAQMAKKYKIPIIADGGIKYSGDITKAIAIGASTVMIGSLFAGTEESPGEKEFFDGKAYKSYRGMGSIAAMNKGSKDRYFQEGQAKLVPEGIEGRVIYKGPVAEVIFQLIGGLKSGMGYCGCENIEELQTKTNFMEVTNAGLKESHPHDVQILKEAPNYSNSRQ